MQPYVLLVLLAGLPILLALLLRVSAIFLFLSVAVGNLLVLFLSDDTTVAVDAFSKGSQTPMIVRLTLLLLPVVFTLFVLRKSLASSKFLLHFLPIIGTGLTLLVLALPILPSEAQAQIFAVPFGGIFKQSQDLIVAITGVLVLLLAFRGYRHKDDKRRGKHH
jgi:hypothetical protein